MVIAVDFDGTCVEHMYPYVGVDVPNAERVLKMLVDKGHEIILYTMRGSVTSPESGRTVLDDAVAWFENKNIPLYGINENPSQRYWTDSEKIYANVYIDDSALGCPCVYRNGERPFVDWASVEMWLKHVGLL